MPLGQRPDDCLVRIRSERLDGMPVCRSELLIRDVHSVLTQRVAHLTIPCRLVQKLGVDRSADVEEDGADRHRFQARADYTLGTPGAGWALHSPCTAAATWRCTSASSGAPSTRTISAPTSRNSCGPSPRDVSAGVPMRMPE